MKSKGIAQVALLLLAVTAVLTVAHSKSWPTPAQQVENSSPERRGTIAWYVKQAKLKGKTKVRLLPIDENPAVVSGVEDAVSKYTVLIAKPVEKKSYVETESNLVTWNKLKILEILSQPPTPACVRCLVSVNAPSDILPLAAGEMLIATNGGSVIVDGIEVISEDKDLGSHFSPSQKYLLFISFDAARGIGKLTLGQYGVFTVDDENLIKPIFPTDDPLQRELDTQLNWSLSRLKEYVQR